MDTFDDIQALWGKQNEPHPSADSPEKIMAKADKNKKELRFNHLSTMAILTVTVGVVIWYASVFGNTTYTDVTIGLFLMIASMILRIGFEYFSFRKFNQISPKNTTKACLEATISFQKLRRRIQFFVTPLSLLSYVLGFIMLLPYIKAGVSEGFYWYILGSGVVLLIFFSVIIYRQIKREIHLMNHLEESYTKLME
jgi:uncharacterized membrane protein (DUF485 family)